MLQKLISVPALLAVLLVSSAGLAVQNTDLGLSLKQPDLSLLSADYPTYSTLIASKHPVKLEAALKAIEAKKQLVVERNQNPAQARLQAPVAPATGGQVASQTIIRPASVPVDIEAAIRKYASEYGANAEVMIAIAKCESGFRAEALSPSGAYGGLYQFVSSTWVSNRRAMGLDTNPDLRFNGEEAIKTAAFKMGRDGYGAWPACHSYARKLLATSS